MNPDNPELTIIIISFNTKKITSDCLESILKSKISCSYELILIDNDSKDGSIEMLRSYKAKHPNIVLIENKNNTGFSRANNQGAKEARGKYLLFLNSDTVVLDNAIDTLYKKFINEKSKVGFAGGKLLNPDNTPQSSTGPFYTLPYMFAWQFLRGDHWGITRSSPDRETYSDWVSGACFITKKDLYDSLGGFDEKIFMYMEEVDLMYRGKNKGYLTKFYPDAKFIHLGSASSAGKTYPVLQVFRGSFYFYNKHFPYWQVLMLKYMLQAKAILAIIIGYLTNNKYLIKTYEEAYRIAKMGR